MNARAALLAMLALGCSHVTKVTNAPEAPEANDAGSAARPAATEHGQEAEPHAARPPKARAAAPGRPLLATSPEGLMLPDGARRLQDALASKAYLHEPLSGSFDAKTQDALRRFQSDHSLPSTGAPDRETLRKLGLDPKQIFRPAEE